MDAPSLEPEALATPEGRKLAALTPHERQLVHGLALWMNGYSIRLAASTAGCAPSTLHQRLTHFRTQRADLIEASTTDALANAHAIEQESGRQTREALEAGFIPPTQAPIVWGISADKVDRMTRNLRAGQEPEQANPLAAFLASAHPGESVTITKGGPDTPQAEPIDITPEPPVEEPASLELPAPDAPRGHPMFDG